MRNIETKSGEETEIDITTMRKEDNNVELKVTSSLTQTEILMVKSLIMKNFQEGNVLNKRRFKEVLQDKIPYLKDFTYNTLYRKAETEYFQALSRIPSEALINKLTEQNDILKEKILEESTEDITKQVAAINKLDETTIKINKLLDTPPLVTLNFKTNIDIDKLVNPMIPIENSNSEEQ